MSDVPRADDLAELRERLAAAVGDDWGAGLIPLLKLHRLEIEQRIAALEKTQTKDAAGEIIGWNVGLSLQSVIAEDLAYAVSAPIGSNVFISQNELLSIVAHAIAYGQLVGTLAGDDMSSIREGAAKGGRNTETRLAKAEAWRAIAKPLIIKWAAGGPQTREWIAREVLFAWPDDKPPGSTSLRKLVSQLVDEGVIMVS